MIGRAGAVLCFGVAFLGCPLAASAQCALPVGMNGVFRGNDGGVYYVRQVGAEVWWLGESPDGGKRFTNVFHGARSGDVVNGTWADVTGQMHNSGVLELRISEANGGVTGWTRTAATGGFTGSTWTFPCGDSSAQPG